jgi:signal transduction histidine kinase
MTTTNPTSHPANHRILIVDDNPAIHEDFRTVLGGLSNDAADIDAEAAAILGITAPAKQEREFELDFAHQGEEALEKVKRARADGCPYAMAFVDMRMPPGWDGLTTISRLWEVDDVIQIVICTAYSDRSWNDIQNTLTERDRWLVLKKPFDKIEVLQLAHALTEKWQLARLAKLKMEELEWMVAQRTSDLERAHRVTREFLANASHELLTPMNGICGSLALLAHSSPNREQQQDIERAQQCADDLLRLISQILDFNRAEAGTLVPDAVEFSPRELLATMVRDCGLAAMSNGLHLDGACEASLPERWSGPVALIQRTMGLLIDNAIKFTTTGSVVVRCHGEDGALNFSVTDTGVGMTAKQLEWIQTPFAQVDGGTTRRSSGIGLGLPLAKRLVRLMGGMLTVDNTRAGAGTSVSFTAKASALSRVAA